MLSDGLMLNLYGSLCLAYDEIQYLLPCSEQAFIRQNLHVLHKFIIAYHDC